MPSAGQASLHLHHSPDEVFAAAFEKAKVDLRVRPEDRLERGLVEPIDRATLALHEFDARLFIKQFAKFIFFLGHDFS